MQHSTYETIHNKQGRGGRVSSSRLRESITLSQEFDGLEQSVKPFDLLKLVKRAGKAAGFTPKMIQLLDHYMMFTREIDWQKGSQPIVYQSLYKTAMDLGVSDRQIQKLEKQLFEVGALTWNDSGNCKRYGQRCPDTGRILYAFGVDLTPLAYLKDALEDIIHEQELYRAAWMETKRQVSWHRGQIKALLAEMSEREIAGQGAFESRYEQIAVPYRASMSLEVLRAMLAEHKALYESVMEVFATSDNEQKTQISSSTNDSSDVHKQNTKQNSFNKLNTRRDPSHCLREGRNENSEGKCLQPDNLGSAESAKSRTGDSENTENLLVKAGLQHITAKQVLNASSERFRAHLPLVNRPLNFEDIVSAAYALRTDLHISQKSWSDACEVLTRYGASIVLMLVDQAAQREKNPVRKPAAYFNGMIARARAGDLRLHKSVFGLLKREIDTAAANSNTHSTEKEA